MRSDRALTYISLLEAVFVKPDELINGKVGSDWRKYSSVSIAAILNWLRKAFA
jgi:hypothetical protein